MLFTIPSTTREVSRGVAIPNGFAVRHILHGIKNILHFRVILVHTMGARCASMRARGYPGIPLFPISSIFLPPVLRGWPRLPSTAHIGRAHSYRARSASKEGTWPLPGLSWFESTSQLGGEVGLEKGR